MDDYRAIKQRLACSIRSQFDGAEMLNLKQAAQVLGYKNPAKARRILDSLPSYEFSKRSHKWSATDIAAELARRVKLPGSAS